MRVVFLLMAGLYTGMTLWQAAQGDILFAAINGAVTAAFLIGATLQGQSHVS